MATDTIQQKHQAHAMVDLLAPEELSAVVSLLKVIVDPVARAIAHAPVESEPPTQDEENALREAREWLERNRGIPHSQVLDELGITQEDIENYRDTA